MVNISNIWDDAYLDMGVADILLLEFQNISKASLLFGSTWIVNAYMFTSIMILVLLANICEILG